MNAGASDHRPSIPSDDPPEEVKVLSTPGQLKAVTSPIRARVLALLSEGPATVTQLAETLGQSKGSLSYHVKLLETEGLVKIVGTRKVRAVEERWYGRTAKRFEVLPEGDSESGDQATMFLRELIQGAQPTPFDSEVPQFVVSHARVPTKRAREFAERLAQLAREFKAVPEQGEAMYVFLGGVFVTNPPQEDGNQNRG